MYSLISQVAFAYGYGAIKWGYDPYNAIYVPNALFSYTEDESQ
jgi:predicted GNAT superfamily acetyltransferase